MYKRQQGNSGIEGGTIDVTIDANTINTDIEARDNHLRGDCLLYTSDAADERSSVDLGGRRIIKKKTKRTSCGCVQT